MEKVNSQLPMEVSAAVVQKTRATTAHVQTASRVWRDRERQWSMEASGYAWD